MKQGTIKYSQEFISPTGLKRWIGMEYPLDWETDDPQFILNYLKNMAEAGYSALNSNELSAPGQQGPPAIVADKPIPEDQRVALIIADIYTCTDKLVLESYKLMARTNAEIQAAYDLMMKKLTNA
jgi:hypothetical protein